MANGNSVDLIGNVTKDPELRFTPTGQAVATFGLAVNRRWQNRQTQQWEEAVSYIDIVCWRELAENVTVKVPLTVDGLKACHVLSGEGTMVNVTLCFSAMQALLAAKAGATFISPFVGRLDDIGQDGMLLIEDICTIYSNYDFTTEVLVASVRNPVHILDAARIGADVVTVPPKDASAETINVSAPLALGVTVPSPLNGPIRISLLV